MPAQRSPVKLDKRKHNNVIDIADPNQIVSDGANEDDDDDEEDYSQDFENDDGKKADGQPNKYLKELQRQNKKDAKNAIQGIIKQKQTDQKINLMIGEALTHKEELIGELEKELALERQRREDMNNQFEKQMKEFRDDQKALMKINERSRKMESR